MKSYRREKRSWTYGVPAADGFRVVVAGLFLAWGVSLGLSGLGLGHTLAARYFNDYWTLPFLIYGLIGLLWPRVVHLGFVLSVLVVVGSVLLLLQNVPFAGLHLSSLVAAGVLVLVAALVFTRKRGWWWW